MCNFSGDLFSRHVFPPPSNNTSCKSLLKNKDGAEECWRHREEYNANGSNKRFTSPLLWVGSDQVRTTISVGMIRWLLKVRYLWDNFKLKMILIIWCFPCPVHGDDLTPRCSAWRTLGVVSSAAGSPRTSPGPRGRGLSSVSQTYNRFVSFVLVITHLGGASRPGENLFQDLIDNTSLLKKACDFAYDRLLQPQKSMMMMAIVLYWVTFFIDSLNVECWLWVRQRRRLPGLERGHCQTHKVGTVSKIQWGPSCLSSVNQSALYPDQQVLQRSGLPLPVSADRLPSQVFLS